ncbi:MAG: transcriptional repressor NrdR [Chloroflexi bacterium]|nr:transcriptional repressor NrdR [Chloroflexota bacterium]
MRCPYCHARDTKVTDSRANDDGIRRRRQCIACGERFSTFEAVQLTVVQVIKRDGRREDFNREKLVAGLRKACSKRNVSVAELDLIVSDIEAKVMSDGRAEVPYTFIGELAMDALRKTDHIAYVRFASVYRTFSDIASLKEFVIAVEEGRVASHEERSLQLALPGAIPPDDGPVRARLFRDIESKHYSEPEPDHAGAAG